MNLPTSTYRLQFTPSFRFPDAMAILPYLRRLGVGAVYASPVTRARRGSLHGYDVCDPTTTNPDLGTNDEFESLLRATAEAGMGWIQDIVPNHMAYSDQNPFLMDVLEHGTASRYSAWFDIDWEHPHKGLHGKVLAPFLGKPYGECLRDGELRVVWEDGALRLAYWDHRYPLCPESYHLALGMEDESLFLSMPDLDSESLQTFRESLLLLRDLALLEDPTRRADRCALGMRTLREMMRVDAIENFVRERLVDLSGNGNRLDAVIGMQHYRVAYWRIAAEEINYRRFFTVSDLICLRPEDERVFDATHAYILDLVARGLITGLRIDHIDGLRDPAAYLARLRDRAPNTWIGVEKILDHAERLPSDWPVQGTTGYEVLNQLDALFIDPRGERGIDSAYRKFLGFEEDPIALQLEKKRLIIGRHMAGDIDNVAHLVLGVAGSDVMGRDLTRNGLRIALIEVLANFPVYRTYVTENVFSPDDARRISHALRVSRARLPERSMEFDFIERFLMMKGDEVLASQYDQAWRDAVTRFQQFTGPLMAKGCEDTFFYVYNRFVALNEVGGAPARFGISDRDFHALLKERAATQPFGLTATSTHDTKRGEDTRSRLHVISEIPAEWQRLTNAWRKRNQPLLRKGRGAVRPDPHDEYLLYQTLVGTLDPTIPVDDAYRARIREYAIKAAREAKLNTSWINPNPTYEEVLSEFVDRVLDPSLAGEFLGSMKSFVERISPHGLVNSLSRTLLKCVVPGIPDIYQGSEAGDFTLVDPDNRRLVDYSRLESILAAGDCGRDLRDGLSGAELKTALLSACLRTRAQNPPLFEGGAVVPVVVHGPRARNLVAIARRSTRGTLLCVVPRFTALLAKDPIRDLAKAYEGTFLDWPKSLPLEPMVDVFRGEAFEPGSRVSVATLFKDLPFALLVTGPGSSPTGP